MGSSHFEELPLTFKLYAEVRERPPLQAATDILFLRWPAGYFHDWPNAPRRQYVIVLSGRVEVGIGDGTVWHFGRGDVGLEEDLGEQTGYTASGGTFGTYLGTLRRNGLIEVHGEEVRASATLFVT